MMRTIRIVGHGFAASMLIGGVMLLFVGFKVCEAKKSSELVTYVFGDSLTEVGNNNYLNSLARSDYPWYGVDYNGGQPTGRFTNGRTIGDIICIYSFSYNPHIQYIHTYMSLFLHLVY